MPRGVKKVHTVVKTVDLHVGNATLQVSSELRDTVNMLRAKVLEFGEAFAIVTTKKADIAEAFMDGFTLWQHETQRSFVDYVRAIDSNVPQDREGYRVHKTYMACDYLRRSQTVGRGGPRNASAAPTRSNAVGRMARLLATILSIVKESEHAAIWQALAGELDLKPRQITNLQNAVKATEPLFKLPIKRQITAEVVHMAEHQAKVAA